MRKTPSTIEDLTFIIPLYQRLFEWGSDNVKQLLDDLNSAYEKNENAKACSAQESEEADYYIGMLTSTAADKSKKTLYLVDGQQRFTVMTLMGCVLQRYAKDSWNRFLKINGHARLSFVSRQSDEKYLARLIDQDFDGEADWVNYNMKEAIRTIREYMERYPDEKKEGFAEYIYNHLCFFISELPDNYGVLDLNKYFERMNSSGKNLEHHEILKVKILSKLSGNIPLYMQLWNKIADVDTILLRKKEVDSKCETEAEYSGLKNKVLFSSLDDITNMPSLINGLKGEENEEARSIKSIGMREQKPQDVNSNHFNGSRSVLRFPQLLLQTLYFYLKRKNGADFAPRLDDFFNQNKLLETFQKYLPYEGAEVNKENLKEYFEWLLRCRVVMDVCFVRSLEYGYSLDMNLPEENKDLKELMMFESFLHVSSTNVTNYRWFGWLMDYVFNNGAIPSAQDLFEELRSRCDCLNELPAYEDLCFGEDIRYWFWRLDFYIWQHRQEIFSTEEDPRYLSIAENYVFIRNRSIEHIAPQHPKTESRLQWEETKDDAILRNSFGNLVMISQSLNSALSNSSFEEKRAHVASYFNSVNGTIESLKLLMVYKDSSHDDHGWTKEDIRRHGENIYLLLKKAIEHHE